MRLMCDSIVRMYISLINVASKRDFTYGRKRQVSIKITMHKLKMQKLNIFMHCSNTKKN